MAEPEIHVDDVGTVFRATIRKKTDNTPQNISAATEMYFVFTRPDGTSFQKNVAFSNDGSDGKVEYTTVAGDLNMQGNWRLQAYVDLPEGEWRSSKHAFKVYGNL